MMNKQRPIDFNCPACEDNYMLKKVDITEVVRYPDRFYWHCKSCNEQGFIALSSKKRDADHFWRNRRTLR